MVMALLTVGDKDADEVSYGIFFSWVEEFSTGGIYRTSQREKRRFVYINASFFPSKKEMAFFDTDLDITLLRPLWEGSKVKLHFEHGKRHVPASVEELESKIEDAWFGMPFYSEMMQNARFVDDFDGLWIVDENDNAYGVIVVRSYKPFQMLQIEMVATTQEKDVPSGTLLLATTIYVAFYVHKWNEVVLTTFPESRAYKMYKRMGFRATGFDEARLSLKASDFSVDILLKLIQDRSFHNRVASQTDPNMRPLAPEFVNLPNMTLSFKDAKEAVGVLNIYQGSKMLRTKASISPPQLYTFVGPNDAFVRKLLDSQGELQGWVVGQTIVGSKFEMLLIPQSEQVLGIATHFVL